MGENEEQWGKDRWYDSSKVLEGPSRFWIPITCPRGWEKGDGRSCCSSQRENGAFPRQRTDFPHLAKALPPVLSRQGSAHL